MILSLGFHGARTHASAASTALDRDVLGSVDAMVGPDAVAS